MKTILAIFIWINITACSSTKNKTKELKSNFTNFDTTYSASTKQLMSNNIPDSVFRMTELLHLEIGGMDCDYGDTKYCWTIRQIPNEIRNLIKLKPLRLTLNSITKIPAEISLLKQLKLIDLTDNVGLKDFESVTEIEGLEYLYLYGCSLSRLPKNIFKLKNLKELGLVGNILDPIELERIKLALPNCKIISE